VLLKDLSGKIVKFLNTTVPPLDVMVNEELSGARNDDFIVPVEIVFSNFVPAFNFAFHWLNLVVESNVDTELFDVYVSL